MSAPVNRRAVLGSIAVAGAMLAAPAAAVASHPDAELFAFSRRARALNAEYDELNAKCEAAIKRMGRAPIPETLICREGDDVFLSKEHLKLGQPLFPVSYEEALATRDMMLKLCGRLAMSGREVGEEGVRIFERSCEIARDAPVYEAACVAARKASGVAAFNEEIDRVWAELLQVFREIAFTAAKTNDGVLAKLAACGSRLAEDWPLDPEDADEDEEISVARVAEAAAIDYAALLKMREASHDAET